ncbi:uncharacterized protein J3D65DRAFT_457122 [Phyllosticta citribraziliensis]|uniref:C2H2-type domain-containing protein n=1 Tax=Phyllosticta citribraziliensis TaxID=989973 RepID=A0ABR1LF08_9PEZI
MPCSNPLHSHVWPTSGELTIWHCERQCGFCQRSNFKQTSHLRDHAKLHKKQYPDLEVLRGELGNKGKYYTERHKPRKPKAEKRVQHAVEAYPSGQSSKQSYPLQLPLPTAPTHLHEQPVQVATNTYVAAPPETSGQVQDFTTHGSLQTALGQDLGFSNNAMEPCPPTGPADLKRAFNHASPAETSFSGYYSAPMSRGPSYGTGNAYFSGYNPEQQPLTLPTRSNSLDTAVEFHQPEQDMLAQVSPLHAAEGLAPFDNIPIDMTQFDLPLPDITFEDFIAGLGNPDDFVLQPIAAEKTTPTQSQEECDDSPVTFEALQALDAKLDEIEDVLADGLSKGARLHSLKARILQRMQTIGNKPTVQADLSSME